MIMHGTCRVEVHPLYMESGSSIIYFDTHNISRRKRITSYCHSWQQQILGLWTPRFAILMEWLWTKHLEKIWRVSGCLPQSIFIQLLWKTIEDGPGKQQIVVFQFNPKGPAACFRLKVFGCMLSNHRLTRCAWIIWLLFLFELCLCTLLLLLF
jgi:hypothetical protein